MDALQRLAERWTLYGSGTMTPDGCVTGIGRTSVEGRNLKPNEVVEVVPASQLRGAVEALEAIRDALKGREINTADAWFAYDRANDYLTALGGQ